MERDRQYLNSWSQIIPKNPLFSTPCLVRHSCIFKYDSFPPSSPRELDLFSVKYSQMSLKYFIFRSHQYQSV